MSLLLIAHACTALAQTTSTENSIRAVYLFHFAQFVDWPESAFSSTNAPFVIGVYGDDSLSSSLEEAVVGEVARGRKIGVKRCVSLNDAPGCQIVFISHSEGARLDRILARTKGKSILTVSDIDGFTSRGGMIRFLTERNRVHLRINADEPQKVGLTISSKLLRLAEPATPGKS